MKVGSAALPLLIPWKLDNSFDGNRSRKEYVSMTINSPGGVARAMYLVVAEKKARVLALLPGKRVFRYPPERPMIRVDIARRTYITPNPSMALVDGHF